MWDYAYYTTDAQGSTRQEITENKPIPKPNTYYAYGSPVTNINAQTQKVEDTYTGQKKDEETNLMYYNARYYNPATGLFLQADSVDDTPNKYQYVASNPVNNVDPSGNEVKCIPLIMPCGKTDEEIRDEGYVDEEAETFGDSLMKAGAQIIDGLGLCFTKNCKSWLSPEVHRQNQINQMIPMPAAITAPIVTTVKVVANPYNPVPLTLRPDMENTTIKIFQRTPTAVVEEDIATLKRLLDTDHGIENVTDFLENILATQGIDAYRKNEVKMKISISMYEDAASRFRAILMDHGWTERQIDQAKFYLEEAHDLVIKASAGETTIP